VAAARNEGWRRAKSNLIAFMDADDLSAPTRIERQVQVMEQKGQHVGLVYCWSARIDSRGQITAAGKGADYEGDVLGWLCAHNFVGNGSAALIRRRALIDAHGFDSRLRAARAEGCEDYLLYYRVAERYHFAVVPEVLVGYRYLPDSMSSKRVPMLRSWLLVLDEIRARHPEHADALARGLRHYGSSLAQQTLSIARVMDLPPLLLLLLRHRPSTAMRVLLHDLPRTLVRKVSGRLRRLYRRDASAGSAVIIRRFPVGDLE
jgi:glycosyltransferase involved in cell wall biosynthesis